MGLFPKIRPRQKKQPKPVVIDMDKLATKEDIAKYAEELKQAKLKLAIALLTPRQREKLSRIIAQKKARQHGERSR